jgi:2-dehydro-3-deoxygalactonokinase
MTPFCAAIDWGTSSFRLWLLAEDGTVLAERRSEEGMIHAAGKGFGAVMERHLGELEAPNSLPVIICGMAGARQGWREAGYVDTPCDLADIARNALRVRDHPREVRILSGIAQREAGAPDVMRGEETQLLGLVASGLQSGLICMPGTHSKWVTLREGRVEHFASYMTGELFALLAGHSTLSAAVGASPDVQPDDPVFIAAAKAIADSPEALANLLFQCRAAQLLGFTAPGDGAARLSGLLIGLELAGAAARFDSFAEVVLVASGKLSALYRAALELRHAAVLVCDAEEAVRHGLWSTAHAIWGAEGEQIYGT